MSPGLVWEDVKWKDHHGYAMDIEDDRFGNDFILEDDLHTPAVEMIVRIFRQITGREGAVIGLEGILMHLSDGRPFIISLLKLRMALYDLSPPGLQAVNHVRPHQLPVPLSQDRPAFPHPLPLLGDVLTLSGQYLRLSIVDYLRGVEGNLSII
jgi:hypothetical protein